MSTKSRALTFQERLRELVTVGRHFDALVPVQAEDLDKASAFRIALELVEAQRGSELAERGNDCGLLEENGGVGGLERGAGCQNERVDARDGKANGRGGIGEGEGGRRRGRGARFEGSDLGESNRVLLPLLVSSLVLVLNGLALVQSPAPGKEEQLDTTAVRSHESLVGLEASNVF